MDDDIKIYGENKIIDIQTQKALEIAHLHRENGNIEKASELGVALGTIDTRNEINQILSPDAGEEAVLQARILLLFTAEITLQLCISAPMISTTAVNSMYDIIRQKKPDYYNLFSNGLAYTFYYSAVNEGSDVSENIGKVFAMLCDERDNEKFIRMGQALYERSAKRVCEEIEKVRFKEI